MDAFFVVAIFALFLMGLWIHQHELERHQERINEIERRIMEDEESN